MIQLDIGVCVMSGTSSSECLWLDPCNQIVWSIPQAQHTTSDWEDSKCLLESQIVQMEA